MTSLFSYQTNNASTYHRLHCATYKVYNRARVPQTRGLFFADLEALICFVVWRFDHMFVQDCRSPDLRDLAGRRCYRVLTVVWRKTLPYQGV